MSDLPTILKMMEHRPTPNPNDFNDPEIWKSVWAEHLSEESATRRFNELTAGLNAYRGTIPADDIDGSFTSYFMRASQELDRETNWDNFKKFKFKKRTTSIANAALLIEGIHDLVLIGLLENARHYESLRYIAAHYNPFVNDIQLKAELNAPLLITGNSGTGKEAMAYCIHMISGRRKEPFKSIDCSAFSGDLIASELFGTVKGAFTGAIDKPGLLESANGGTVFLDEIANMPKPQQAMLLRVIESGKLRRVGANEDIKKKLDVRYIAAVQPSKENELLPDLLYRLTYPFCIRLPSLKERFAALDDDQQKRIINHSLKRLTRRESSIPSEVAFTVSAINRLVAHDYPGNYRELENTLLIAIINAQNKHSYNAKKQLRIDTEHLPTIAQHTTANPAENLIDISSWSLMDLAIPDKKLAPFLAERVMGIYKDGSTPSYELSKEGGNDAKFGRHFEKMVGVSLTEFKRNM